MNGQDWRKLIDGSFGDGPGHVPIAERVAAGRRAVRRRRLAVGATTTVVAVVAGGALWVAAPSETGTVDTPTSGSPSIPSAGDDRGGSDGGTRGGSELDGAIDQKSFEIVTGDIVTMTDAGWEVAPGWDVTVRILNPMEYQPPMRSVAMAMQKGPERLYVMAIYDGECCTSIHPAPALGSFEAWLGEAVVQARHRADEGHGVDRTESAPVHFGEGETLVPADGVTILDQVPHPDLPRNFAGPNDRSAAAWIEDHGEKTFVLVRETYGEEQVIPWDKGDFESLEAFLQFAKQRYEDGVGLL